LLTSNDTNSSGPVIYYIDEIEQFLNIEQNKEYAKNKLENLYVAIYAEVS